MPWPVVTVLLGLSWVLASSYAATLCPQGCSCQPEGRGQSVWCSGQNLSSTMSQLPHNTARLSVRADPHLQSLSADDLEGAPMSIQHLSITGSDLQSLQDSAFSAAFTSLLELDLGGNKLKTIAEGAFLGLSGLRLLNLSSNDLDLLGSCLAPLVSLQQLDISHNFLHQLTPSTLHAQSSLTYLRLDTNELTSLDHEAFQALSFLSELRASNCSISSVSQGLLSLSLPRMSLLDLSHNRLTSFPSSRAFKNLPKLKTLYLNHNKLLQLEPKQFDGMRLRMLSLAHNRLGALSSQDFVGMTVGELDLSENTLQELSPETFQPLAGHLQSLSLAYNPVRSLSPEMFRALSTLESLNVSACSLSSLPTEVFSSLYNLRTLDVSENLLQNISRDMVSVFSRLVRVSLQDNPWRCDCHISPFSTWLQSRQSIHKLFCPHRNHRRDCTELRCASPEEVKGQLLYNVGGRAAMGCGSPVRSAGMAVPVQISIVAACLLVAFATLFLTIYLWKRGRTRRELTQLFKKHKGRKPDSHEEGYDDDENEDRIEPFIDCDNESLKESHRSFIFKEFFDKMITDPSQLDALSQEDLEEEVGGGEVGVRKQKDSMYSSNPSLYEKSHRSCSVVVVGIESTV